MAVNRPFVVGPIDAGRPLVDGPVTIESPFSDSPLTGHVVVDRLLKYPD